MTERHNILTQTIGYHKEEQDALNSGYYLLIGSSVLVIVGSFLVAWFFWLYNGPLHPFANILKGPPPPAPIAKPSPSRCCGCPEHCPTTLNDDSKQLQLLPGGKLTYNYVGY